jgi:riboflavin biosynthesis pyrimidine reductase
VPAADVLFERLLPPGAPGGAVELLAEQRPWERAFGDRPRVLVNMVATLDGRVTIDGRSGPIGGAGDHALFHGLRTVVDAILVGSGTLRAERYGRMVRNPERRAQRAALGLDEDPLALLITHSGRLPWDAPLFAAPEQRIAVVTHPRAAPFPAVDAQLERIDLSAPTPAAALREIHRQYGTRAVLCEGGPTLNRGLIEDGVFDELFLTLGPLIGGGDDVLRILAGEELPVPARLHLAGVLRHEDELYLRYELTPG